MDAHVFTLRDLEEARRRGRHLRSRRAAVEMRSHLLALVLLAACWLARSLLLH
jgi:hypothetical protein